MKFSIMEGSVEIAKKISAEIAELINKKPDANICIAAGHSSLPLIKELIKLYSDGSLDFSRAKFTAMDEWLNMNHLISGSCGDFLQREFISKVNFKSENVVLVDGCAKNLESECARIGDAIYKRGGLDYIVLGVGMNGHLALNEPGTDEDCGVHVSELDNTTKNVGTKYFDTAPSLEGGLTIGIGDIKKAKRIVLCINGEHKKEIVKRFYDSAPTRDLPVSFLKNCENAEILCDKASAALIDAK